MAFLAPIRDRLCYPAGYRPGIDPTHLAVRKFLRFSGVASGNNFVRLDKLPIKGTVTATITGGIHGGIGPYIQNSNTAGFVSFAGNSVVAPTSGTLAAIGLTGTSTANQWTWIGVTSAVASVPFLGMLAVNPGALCLFSINGTINIVSSITLSVSTPYFVAASYPINSAGFVNFVATNLVTGQILQSSIANAVGATASNGTYCLLGDPSDTVDSSVAAAMYSTAGLSPADLRAWAGDPWAFWYPDITAMDDFLVGSSFIPPSATPLGGSLLPMMGVG